MHVRRPHGNNCLRFTTVDFEEHQHFASTSHTIFGHKDNIAFMYGRTMHSRLSSHQTCAVGIKLRQYGFLLHLGSSSVLQARLDESLRNCIQLKHRDVLQATQLVACEVPSALRETPQHSVVPLVHPTRQQGSESLEDSRQMLDIVVLWLDRRFAVACNKQLRMLFDRMCQGVWIHSSARNCHE